MSHVRVLTVLQLLCSRPSAQGCSGRSSTTGGWTLRSPCRNICPDECGRGYGFWSGHLCHPVSARHLSTFIYSQSPDMALWNRRGKLGQSVPFKLTYFNKMSFLQNVVLKCLAKWCGFFSLCRLSCKTTIQFSPCLVSTHSPTLSWCTRMTRFTRSAASWWTSSTSLCLTLTRWLLISWPACCSLHAPQTRLLTTAETP